MESDVLPESSKGSIPPSSQASPPGLTARLQHGGPGLASHCLSEEPPSAKGAPHNSFLEAGDMKILEIKVRNWLKRAESKGGIFAWEKPLLTFSSF